MSDFSVRSDSIDVEQIMEQIRARIHEKRGVDYTEQQLRELAAVKLEKFLDPRHVRSDLLARFKERQPQYVQPKLPLYTFEDTTIYETHRGPLQWIRRVLNPVLKLLFNPNPIIHALHAQAAINALNLEREEAQEKRRMEMESLYYEIIHNLVFEMTRTGIEVKNLKMRVESLASRLEFNERRMRALESVVVYKPTSADRQEAARAEADIDRTPPAAPGLARPERPAESAAGGIPPEGPGQRSRRRRRRRGRRSGAPAAVVIGGSQEQGAGIQGGERPETIEQAIAAESHPSEPPSPGEPAPSSTSGGGEPQPAPPVSWDPPSGGLSESSRGESREDESTHSGSSRPESRDDQQ